MLNVNDYIKLILKKKKWTNVKLCQELNKIEERIGDKKTTKQNVTNYLNNYHTFGYSTLIKYEVALQLPLGELLQFVQAPKTKRGRKNLNKFIKKVRGD